MLQFVIQQYVQKCMTVLSVQTIKILSIFQDVHMPFSMTSRIFLVNTLTLCKVISSNNAIL